VGLYGGSSQVSGVGAINGTTFIVPWHFNVPFQSWSFADGYWNGVPIPGTTDLEYSDNACATAIGTFLLGFNASGNFIGAGVSGSTISGTPWFTGSHNWTSAGSYVAVIPNSLTSCGVSVAGYGGSATVTVLRRH
jgi:hypothetical protein